MLDFNFNLPLDETPSSSLLSADLGNFNDPHEAPFELENALTPSTVQLYSDGEEPLFMEPSQTMAEEYFNFYDNSTDKVTYTQLTSNESHDQHSVSSPADSVDLLDLESYASSSTWRPADDHLADPDWMPTTISENPKFVTDKKSGKRKLRPQTSQPCNKLKCPSTAKVAKRRSSSITSELELQIEIEESTKRAKRCTAPLTEEQKQLRRKELNRLAAQRCRSKRKSHAEVLEEEIEELTKKNKILREQLEELESTKTELYDIIKFHFAKCHSSSE